MKSVPLMNRPRNSEYFPKRGLIVVRVLPMVKHVTQPVYTSGVGSDKIVVSFDLESRVTATDDVPGPARNSNDFLLLRFRSLSVGPMVSRSVSIKNRGTTKKAAEAANAVKTYSRHLITAGRTGSISTSVASFAPHFAQISVFSLLRCPHCLQYIQCGR